MIGGIYLEGKKESSLLNWLIKRPRIPESVRISLHQGRGIFATPCVEVGREVLIGEKIAQAYDSLSVPIHASVSGRVTSVEPFPHPEGPDSLAIEICSDRNGRKMSSVGVKREGWERLSEEELLSIFREMGLIGMDDEAQALHVKYEKENRDRIKTLIINGCESEPYVSSAHALMMSHPVEMLKGAKILQTLCGAGRVVLAIQDDQLEVGELLKSKVYFLKWNDFEVAVLKSRYPQGALFALLREVMGIDLFGSRASLMKAAFSESANEAVSTLALEAGFSIEGVSTAYAVYDAVACQKPLYERVVTVAGECVIEPRNMWLPIGLSLGDGFKTCRGFMREPHKVLMGGPMTGKAQTTLKVSLLKGTDAILALSPEVTKPQAVAPCIHCGDCVDACPVEISPVMITLAAERELFEIAREWGSDYCIGCGNCSYVCPAKRPMLELIQVARGQGGAGQKKEINISVGEIEELAFQKE